MKIQFKKKVIEEALQKTIRAVSPRSPLPILNFVLLKTEEDGKVSFSTTDLEFGITCTIDANVIEGGSVCVPAKIITDLVTKIPDDSLTMTYDEEKEQIELATSRSRYHMYVREADAFPVLPKFSGESTFTLPQATLKDLIKSVIIAVAPMEDQRPVLTGVLLSLSDTTITAVATDSRRLAKASEPMDESFKEDISVIIHQRPLKEVINLLRDTEDPVSFTLSQGQVFFEFDNIKLFTRVVDGKFPNYEVVIPKSADIKVLVDRRKFQDAVRRALIMAADKITPDLLKMDFSPQSVKIMSNSVDVGDAYEEVPTDEYEGDPIDIAINGRYVFDVLNVMKEDQVWVYLNSPVMPVMFKSLEREDYCYIVMPVRLREEEAE